MIIDYLTFTFPKDKEESLSSLVKQIDPGAIKLDTKTGYAEDWTVWGTGRLKWDHAGDTSARLSLPGKALALVRESGAITKEFIITILEAGAKCTRIDYAFDWDIEASPFIDRIVENIQAGNYTSRWRLHQAVSCKRIRAVCGPGDTLYLGSSSSDVTMRIYDKAAEQGEDTPRLRMELQVRKERAEEYIIFATIDAESAVGYVKPLILGYIDFKQPNGDDNKTRWPTASWWSALWGNLKDRLVLGSEPPKEDASRAFIERLGQLWRYSWNLMAVTLRGYSIPSKMVQPRLSKVGVGVQFTIPSSRCGSGNGASTWRMILSNNQDVLILRGRLDTQQKYRLVHLLDMLYKPKELADEIGFTVRQVYRVYVPAGCPHQKDADRHLWINGKAFREWYQETYKKHKLTKDQAFCLTCKRAVKIIEPVYQEQDGLKYLTCSCPNCGRNLAKITDKIK